MNGSKNISTIAQRISNDISVDAETALKIIQKAIAGGEVDLKKPSSLTDWYEQRFLPNIVFIDENSYARMLVDALKNLGNTAATDFGSSRQRDFGQIWADKTRGYLAEQAFSDYLRGKWKISSELAHEAGELEEFLQADIHFVTIKGEGRKPKINVGVKGSKWNGIWLDVPGAQFHHSAIHVFVKVGVGRDHLFAYFKHISVFKDKILKKGVEVGVLDSSSAEELYNELPGFSKIPAYIAGFAVTNKEYPPLNYRGRKGRIHFKVDGWSGPIRPGDLDLVKIQEGISGKVTFEGIENFSHDNGYLFNTGSLLWRNDDWQKHVIGLL